MHRLWKIAAQEFKMMAGNKAFVIITLLGPFLILAVAVLPTLLATSQEMTEGTTVAVYGAQPALIDELNLALQGSRLSLTSGSDLQKLKDEVRGKQLSGLVILPDNYLQAEKFTYFSNTGADLLVYETLRGVLGNSIVSKRYLEAGIDSGLVNSLSARPRLEIIKLTGEDKEEVPQDFMSIMLTVIAFVMLIYMTVLLYGQMIGRSVVQEKTAKTVEIMLSSVTPRQLMFGKIIGLGLASIIQYAFWVSLALVLIYFIGPLFSLTIPATLNLTNIICMVCFFLIAYFLYSSAYAAIGAAAEDEQHIGQLGMPLIFLLIIPMLTVSTLVLNPSSPLCLILSYFPFTAPLVMLIRVIVAMPPLWEILLSMGLTIATIFLVVFAAARIFRVGILMTGKRFKFGEILKWIRIK